MQVHVAHADLTNMPVDAIVNPAISSGTMDLGVAGSIREQGGDEIQAAVVASAPIAVGAAVVTTAGRLPAKSIIHVPTSEESGERIGTENIRRAARAALLAAQANGYRVLAFPGMGTGNGGVPMEEAARAIVEEIRAHRKPNPEVIYLVDRDPSMVAAFEEALENAQLGL
jgi:O-acetyl-ADP-ribose deacetylase (regulator of RNase III)